jgi:hypothetical protein
MLINSGASHNFIDYKLVKAINLSLVEPSKFHVDVWDGFKINCQGVYGMVEMQLQNLWTQQDLFLFELGGADVLLGVEWFAGLGQTRANFKDLTMSPKVEEKVTEL